MGEVYRARDARLDRDVAIKVLPASFAAGRRRARAASSRRRRPSRRSNHPNILAIYDIGDARRRRRTSSRSCSRARRCASGSPAGALPPRKAIDFALQIAHGLAAAHEKGIVHRDLKPENVFVTQRRPRQDPRLRPREARRTPTRADRGTNAPTVPRGTEPGRRPGHGRLHVARAGARASRPTRARDIFSFGASSTRCSRAGGPFQRRHGGGDDDGDPEGGSARPAPHGPDIPPALERIVRHCLEKNPESASSPRATSRSTSRTRSAPPRRVRTAIPPADAERQARRSAALAGRGAGRGRAPRRSASSPPAGSEASRAQITYRRLTFRRGFISAARFAPDGHTSSTAPRGATSRCVSTPHDPTRWSRSRCRCPTRSSCPRRCRARWPSSSGPAKGVSSQSHSPSARR